MPQSQAAAKPRHQEDEKKKKKNTRRKRKASLNMKRSVVKPTKSQNVRITTGPPP